MTLEGDVIAKHSPELCTPHHILSQLRARAWSIAWPSASESHRERREKVGGARSHPQESEAETSPVQMSNKELGEGKEAGKKGTLPNRALQILQSVARIRCTTLTRALHATAGGLDCP